MPVTAPGGGAGPRRAQSGARAATLRPGGRCARQPPRGPAPPEPLARVEVPCRPQAAGPETNPPFCPRRHRHHG